MLQLSEFVYGAHYPKRLILLDLRSDAYNVYPVEDPKQLFDGKPLSTSEVRVREELIDRGLAALAVPGEQRRLPVTASKSQTHGICNPHWSHRPRNQDLRAQQASFSIAWAAWNSILQVYAARSYGGMGSVVNIVRKTHQSSRNHAVSLDALQAGLAACIRRVPYKVECLEWSGALTVLLRNYGYPASLHVGVHPTPFMAHAWVELDGECITDADNPQRALCCILTV